MISLIYAGNEKGKCKDILQRVEKLLLDQEYQKFNLQNDQHEIYSLSKGYHTKMSEYQIRSIEKLNKSELFIFIYPLYWLNLPMILKEFIDMVFWPEYAFSFKRKKYFKNGLWKDKRAIIIYTLGGSEWFHILQGRLGYRVMKYPLKLAGIKNIKHFYIDNLSKSTNDRNVNKVIKKIEKVL